MIDNKLPKVNNFIFLVSDNGDTVVSMGLNAGNLLTDKEREECLNLRTEIARKLIEFNIRLKERIEYNKNIIEDKVK